MLRYLKVKIPLWPIMTHGADLYFPGQDRSDSSMADNDLENVVWRQLLTRSDSSMADNDVERIIDNNGLFNGSDSSMADNDRTPPNQKAASLGFRFLYGR